jgi:hypothetical protein
MTFQQRKADLRFKAFNPEQPRDEEGQWTNGGGSSGDGSGGGEPIKPVSARTKLTIQGAAKELDKRGYKLGPGRADLKAGTTVYTVTDRKGVTVEVSAKDIENFLKGKTSKLKYDPTQPRDVLGRWSEIKANSEVFLVRSG